MINIEQALNLAKTNILSNKEHVLVPVLIITKKDEQSTVVGMPDFPDTPDAKEALMFYIGQKIGRDVIQCMHISDAWFASITEEEIKNIGSVATMPDRKEAIVIYSADLDGKREMVMLPYHHDGDDLVFEEIQKTDNSNGDLRSHLLDAFFDGAVALNEED